MNLYKSIFFSYQNFYVHNSYKCTFLPITHRHNSLNFVFFKTFLSTILSYSSYKYFFLSLIHIHSSMSIVFLILFLRSLHYLSHLSNLSTPYATMNTVLMSFLTSIFSYILNNYSHDYTNTILKLTCLQL